MSALKAPQLAILIVLAVVALWGIERWLSAERIVAPNPPVSSDPMDPLELQSSTLTVPIRVDLGALLEEVEEEVPAEWGSLDEWLDISSEDGPSVAIALSRTPFQASFEETMARLSATVSYRLRRRYDLPLLPDPTISCGTDQNTAPPRLSVSLEGRISLTQDWRLSSETQITELRPASEDPRDRCEVTIAGIDVTGRVVEMARSFLQDHTPAIDSLIGKANVRPSFESWWDLLREPIGLDDNVWLEFRPSGITQGPIRGDGDAVEIVASLTARPRISLGSRPSVWPRPLPLLEVGPAGREGLSILVEGSADYEAASDRLTQALRGTGVERAGRHLQIETLEVSGIGGGRVAVRAEVSGDVEGHLFFTGTPRYDPEIGLVSVPDLGFAVATSNLLVSGLSWVADVGLEALLRERAQWPVAVAVEWAADRLHEGINRELAEGVRLAGTVREARIVGVTARTDRLAVWAAASAEAALLIDER